MIYGEFFEVNEHYDAKFRTPIIEQYLNTVYFEVNCKRRSESAAL